MVEVEGREQVAGRGSRRGNREGPFPDLGRGREPHGGISILERSFWPQLRRGFCYKLLVARNATAWGGGGVNGAARTPEAVLQPACQKLPTPPGCPAPTCPSVRSSLRTVCRGILKGPSPGVGKGWFRILPLPLRSDGTGAHCEGSLSLGCLGDSKLPSRS